MSWYVLQTVMGAVGSLGFAILFGVRDRKLIPITAGGALAWSVYLVSVHKIGTDMFMGLFAAALATTLLAELLARLVRTPVVLLLVPMLIPLIPGGDLYYMMDYYVRKSLHEFGAASKKVMTEAGAIAMGIIIGAYIATFAATLLKKVSVHHVR